MENPKVGPGMFVAYSYKLYNDADNSLLFETPAGDPDTMIFGVSRDVVPGLETAMEGLAKGDRFGVTLPPQTAFGERYPENVVELDRSIFMRDGELASEVKVDAELPMVTQDGLMIKGRVLEVGPEKVKMDFNHPFAGLTVRYEGEIDEVRPATPEELHPAHGCGGGCHCSGGCGDGGSCGSGCGCGEGCGCGDGGSCGCDDGGSCGCK